MNHKATTRFRFALLAVLLAGLFTTLVMGPRLLHAAEPDGQALDDVWQRVRQSGAYNFSAQVTQTLTPQSTVANAGRSEKETTIFLEGETDLAADSLILNLWSNGGSVLAPESGAQIKVEGDKAYSRQGDGEWKETDNFTGLFAPGGDFLSYVHSADNVIRHAPERLSTVAGDVLVTRYTFDIDGRHLAEQVREQMRAEAIRDGLPPNVAIELPRTYVDMTGRGELWVGEDGLPLRQKFDLQFPERADNYLPTARATVDFSDFNPLPPATFSSQAIGMVTTAAQTASNPGTTLPATAAVLALALAAALIIHRRSRRVYATVALSVMLSMVVTPLLNNNRVVAYSVRQEERQTQEQAKTDKREAQAELEAELLSSSFDPNADPLMRVQGQLELAASNDLTASNALAASDSNDKYFDPVCESDPDGDMDGDQLTNLQECILGTLPDVADTDGDNLDDGVEVMGVVLTDNDGVNRTWYTDPLQQDSNMDGLSDGREWLMDANNDGAPDDSDGDGEPDMWDQDNDGDGVPDDLDLSPYSNTKGATAFSGDNPFQLVVDGLQSDELVKVEFQLSPTEADHLWYTQNVLDWPDDDLQGPIQDSDGATFFDVDPTLSANPNDNGDMRLIPMMEIEITGSPDNLPSQDILSDFGISIKQTAPDIQTAYVPLQLVTDGTGDKNVAFYGRMFYQPSGAWGAAQPVRLVWLVQALTDQCESYENNICSSYSSLNDLQVIQSYDDDWFLTGFHVTEEHSADMDIIVENPTATATIVADYDKPFYMDTLYGLLYGLDSTFLAGSDCDSLDGSTGDCIGDGQRDMTATEITRRFNHETNGGVSDEERWNLPNVLDVQQKSYESIDLAMMDTTITQTIQILDNTFTSAWSASDPITPTIMYAYEQTYRSLNLDETLGGSSNLNWTGNNLAVNMPSGGADAVEIQTMTSVKWTPYAYDNATGWNTADIQDYYDDLSAQLGSSFNDITDPQEADTYQTMAQLLYVTIYSGDNNIVQIGDVNLNADYEQADQTLAVTLAVDAGRILRTTMSSYYTYSTQLAQIAETIEATGGEASASAVVSQFIYQETYKYFTTASGAAQLAFVAVVAIVAAVALFATYVLHDTSAAWNITAAVSVGILTTIFSVYKPIQKTVQLVQALTELGEETTVTSAIFATLTSSSDLIKSSRAAGLVGLIIAVAISIGIFLYVVGSGKVHAGTIAFNGLIAATIAAIIIAVLFYVLSLSLVGSILIGIIAVIDIILLLLGTGWSITGWLTTAISGLVYQFDLKEKVDVQAGDLDMALVDENTGLLAGNQMNYDLPITTTLSSESGKIASNSLIYDLSENKKKLSTKIGDRESDWTVSAGSNKLYATVVDMPTLTAMLSAGVNTRTPLILNSAYALLGQSCWVGFCTSKTIKGSSSDDLGGAIVLDVLPATVEEFVDVTTWSGGEVRFADADGDGLLPFDEGGVDPDPTTWDADGDNLADDYELTIRGKTSAEGGADLDPLLADTDGDTIPDNEELRLGTDPGNADTDGDGLSDVAEIAPDGGWFLAYAPDKFTRVWSDPLQADADGDGMSDLFERTQDICPDCAPWADPANPLVYSPIVWNESPVALYVDNDTGNDIVQPGATIVYTTTTANNLSDAQSLVGELSLDLPNGFSGAPLAAGVDIDSGASESLVSQLTVDTAQSGSYVLASTMNLTDLDATVWSWDPPQTTNAATLNSAATPAIARTSGWKEPYVVVANEKPDTGFNNITGYVTAADGSISDAQTITSLPPAYLFTAPDIACDDAGACLVVWGVNVDIIDQAAIYAARLQNGLANPSLLTIWTSEVSGESVTAPVVASDGDDFVIVWTHSTAAGQTQLWVQAVNNDGSVTETPQSLAGPAADLAGATIDWDGVDYAAFWRNGVNLHRADVSDAGQVSGETIIGQGGGWPDAEGSERPLDMAFDRISQQALLLYRADVSGNVQLQARRVNSASAFDPIVLETDALLNSNGVKTALCADPKNGGWVAAWALPGQDLIATQSVGPDGSLRGVTEYVTSATDSGIALACDTPRPVQKLEFEELENATTFADSSGLGNDVTCSSAACPRSGVGGKFGNGALFDGMDDYLDSNAPIVELGKGDFTIGAWVKTDVAGATRDVAIVTKSDGDASWEVGEKSFYLDNSGFPTFVGFGNGYIRSDVAVNDGLWHHIVVVWDYNGSGAGGVGRIYIDGINATAGATDYQAKNNDNTGDALKIARPNYGEAPNFFSGTMDEIEVHNRALTGAEVNDVFEATVAIYDLDEVAGSTTFVNAANNSFDATCSGNSCPVMGVPGIAYTAAQFDGVDDFMQVNPAKRVVAQYQYDFESGVGSGWNKARTDTGMRNDNDTTFLGPFNINDGTARLNLDNLPTHDTIEVTFDLYILGTWDGNSTINGPDDWEWGYDGTKALRSNFSNIDPNTIGFYQLYPAQSWPLSGIKLYGNNGCSSNELIVTADIPHLGDTSMGNNNVSCYKNPTDTVAILYKDGAYGGNSWIVDPKRAAFPDIPNNDISSVRVWSAANTPRTGALGDTLAVNGLGSDNTIYRITKTLSGHTDAALNLYFKGFTGAEWGLDNVVISVQSDGGSLPLTNSSFTLSAWAKRAQSGRGDILLSQGVASANQGLQFGFRNSDQFTCGFWNNDLNTSAAYTDADWHHWACTYDVATRRRTIYRDGVQVAQDTASANYDGFGSTFIGKNLNDGWNFMGEIDEMAVWAEALTAAEIAELTAKIKVEDQSVMTAMLPAADGGSTVSLTTLVLRESTTDVGDNTQTITRTITVDGDAPAVTILSPVNGDHARGSGMLSISGEAADPTTSVEQVEVQIGGGAWEVAAGTESWTHLVAAGALNEGMQTIAVRATDAAGNVSAIATSQVILDRTPPGVDVAETILRIRRDSQGRWRAPFSGNVNDPTVGGQTGSGVSALEALLHNEDELAGNSWQPGELPGADSWSVEYILPGFGDKGNSIANPSGVYTLTVRATDGVDNKTSAADYQTAVVTLDGAGPTITLDSPLTTTTIIPTALTLSGQAVDVSAVSAVEVNFTPAEQIAALGGSVLHLPLDENNATEYFPDQSGANNAAVCATANCPAPDADGQRDSAFSFDGADDYLDTGATVADLAEGDFTIAAWVKTTGVSQGIVTKNDDDGVWEVGEKSLYIDAAGLPRFVGLGNGYIIGAQPVNDGQWHHVAVVWDFTDQSAQERGRIYVDGQDVTSAESDYSPNYADNADDTLKIAEPNYRDSGNDVEAPNYFSGSLDEIMVYGRSLAPYELANLYAYGSGAWAAASLNGDAWSYSVPEGEEGIEGFYQINVRGIDALGNVTPLGGQRVWRGEIDTKPPVVSILASTDSTGGVESTTYECEVTDFNLDDSASCIATGDIPTFRISDRTLTTYDQVDLWYAANITDTSRLYGIDAVRVYSGAQSIDVTIEACDIYGRCSTAEPPLTAPGPGPIPAPQSARVLDPLPGTVLTTLDPIEIGGHVYDENGLDLLFVKVNAKSTFFKSWNGIETNATWRFPWTPPGEGIYHFTPVLAESEGEVPLVATGNQSDKQESSPTPAEEIEDNGQESVEASTVAFDDLTLRQYLPIVATDSQPTSFTVYLPIIQTAIEASDVFTGTVTTIYVDMTPPTVDIEPTFLTSTHAIGEQIVEISGPAADTVLLYSVEVSIDGGRWDMAGIGDGRWRYPWRLDELADGETFEVSVRATDVAGHETVVTKQVEVDIVAPTPGEVTLMYTNGAGQRLPMEPGDVVPDARELDVSWSDVGAHQYGVAFSQTLNPDPDLLTFYDGPGVHVQPVGPGERWYVTIHHIDQVDNASVYTVGPFITAE